MSLKLPPRYFRENPVCKGHLLSRISLHIPAWTPTVQIPLPFERWQSERGLWKLDPVIRFYQKVETACYALLAISGIGAVLYSVSAIIR